MLSHIEDTDITHARNFFIAQPKLEEDDFSRVSFFDNYFHKIVR